MLRLAIHQIRPDNTKRKNQIRKLKPVIDGLLSFVPGVNWFRVKGTGGTSSARYCYSVWLRYLVMAKKNGLNPYPKIIAELGPGDSLGISLAALISGCNKAYAYDVVEHANLESNLSIFEELVRLFKNKTPIPGDDEWPRIIPRLEDYGFPSYILDDSILYNALKSSRLERIRNSIINNQQNNSMIEYKVPWHKNNNLVPESVDMIYSQAVLEHVGDLKSAYSAMYLWLKVNGYMAHTIDFKCHGTADEWNGHWTYSDFVWKLIKGKRPYLLNREPHSKHINTIKNIGFNVICDKKKYISIKIY